MKHFFILMLSLFSINFCLAQAVTGTVTDSNGEPMVGVNVIEKNTSNGVVTDMDGRYRISVPALRFWFLAMLDPIAKRFL